MEHRALDNTKAFKTGPGEFILIWLISENKKKKERTQVEVRQIPGFNELKM